VLQSCGRKPQVSSPRRGVVVVQAIFDDVFKEALDFRVSSENGGGHGTAEEERHSPPWWYEGHKELVHEVYRTSRAYGRAAPSHLVDRTDHPLHLCTSAVFCIWLHHHVVGGGEETLSP
jgi:hypothetical protein